MKPKKLILYLIIFILPLCTVSCLPGITDGLGCLIVDFYGKPSESYYELLITIDRVDIHARGQNWEVIDDDEFVINIVDDQGSDGVTPIKELSHRLLQGVLESGVWYTEIRLKVTDVRLKPKKTSYLADVEYLPVLIPELYKDGYKFDVDLFIGSSGENHKIDITFSPDDCISNDDDGLVFLP